MNHKFAANRAFMYDGQAKEYMSHHHDQQPPAKLIVASTRQQLTEHTTVDPAIVLQQQQQQQISNIDNLNSTLFPNLLFGAAATKSITTSNSRSIENLSSRNDDIEESRWLKQFKGPQLERDNLNLRQENNQIKKRLKIINAKLAKLKQKKAEAATPHTSVTFTAQQSADANVAGYATVAAGLGALRPTTQPLVGIPRGKLSSSLQHPSNINDQRQDGTRMRPLTGRADCPNCLCDRKNSVCDGCCNQNDYLQPIKLTAPPPTDMSYPATLRRNAVEDQITPLAARSSNRAVANRRVQLEETIEELKSGIVDLRKSQQKLEQQRKLANIYKDQWSSGPFIGGGTKTVKLPQSYSSRLDPNLSRDLKALSGYQHVSSQIDTNLHNIAPTVASKPTHDHRRKISSSQQNLTNLHSQTTAIKRSSFADQSHQPTTTNRSLAQPINESGGTLYRSKSELGIQGTKIHCHHPPSTSKAPSQQNITLCEGSNMGSNQDLTNRAQSNTSLENQKQQSQQQPQQQSRSPHDSSDAYCDKLKWFPVFGETMVKQVKTSPARKITKITTTNSRNQPEATTEADGKPQTKQKPTPIHRGQMSSSGARQSSSGSTAQMKVIKGAEKKLEMASEQLSKPEQYVKFGSNLKEDELRQFKEFNSQPSLARDLVHGASLEIARLDKIVTAQQKDLERLRTKLKGPKGGAESSIRPQSGGSGGQNRDQVLEQLKQQLEEAKVKLARTLDEEKHQKSLLQMKVDNSLKKQGDLERDNELLKQSLSKCIDTCIQDIANTMDMVHNDGSLVIDRLLSGGGDNVCDIGNETNNSSLQQTKWKEPSKAPEIIANSQYVKKLKDYTMNVEKQRKQLFDELTREKQLSAQLNQQVKQIKLLHDQCQSEVEQLRQSRDRIERQINETSTISTSINNNTTIIDNNDVIQDAVNNHVETGNNLFDRHQQQQPTTSSQSSKINLKSSLKSTTTKGNNLSEFDESLPKTTKTTEIYKRYMQSITPDIEANRRERQSVLEMMKEILTEWQPKDID